MQLSPTAIEGAFLAFSRRQGDERGFFLRTFCQESLAAAGIAFAVSQVNVSANSVAGTLRGLHYQAAPAAEAKLVRCLRGAVFDVIVDLRPASPSYLKWIGAELTEANDTALCIPKGCAHGYLTLTDDCQMLYAMDAPYDGALARGQRWNDPAFGIVWPAVPVVISERDATYPDYRAEQA